MGARFIDEDCFHTVSRATTREFIRGGYGRSKLPPNQTNQEFHKSNKDRGLLEVLLGFSRGLVRPTDSYLASAFILDTHTR